MSDWTHRNPDEDGRDCRKLVTLEQRGMVWIGVRAFDGKRWLNNGEPESATVIAWMDLPEPAKPLQTRKERADAETSERQGKELTRQLATLKRLKRGPNPRGLYCDCGRQNWCLIDECPKAQPVAEVVRAHALNDAELAVVGLLATAHPSWDAALHAAIKTISALRDAAPVDVALHVPERDR